LVSCCAEVLEHTKGFYPAVEVEGHAGCGDVFGCGTEVV
jgi:hypothetical protein